MELLFIQTGGTIDKDYPKTQKGWAFEITSPAFERILQKLHPSFSYSIIPLLQKDSTEINEADRRLLLETCQQAPQDKIIITHGTDTMIETSHFLSSLSNKTIVITGAMRPERFSNSDAPIQLGIAIGAVQTLKSGVYIAMHGKICPWNQAQRDSNTGNFIC